jgi:hypothetical protein
MHAFECWSRTINLKNNFRIEIICPMTVNYGILFMPLLVVVDIFVRTNMKSTSLPPLELGGCKLSGVATASNFLEFEIEH